MQQYINVCFWVVAAYLFYKFASAIRTSRIHSQAADKLGCKLPPRIRRYDLFGLKNLQSVLGADKEGRYPQFQKERADAHCAREGRVVTTWIQSVLVGVFVRIVCEALTDFVFSSV
jgi:hypothetical protein